MKKNLWILLKCIVVIVMLVNLPYPKVYSESQVEIASKQEEQDEITQTVNKSNGKSIYIYNTHQSEEYESESVVEGSKYLMKLLQSKGYEVVYETTDFEKYKKEHNISYNYSYSVSRLFTQKAISEHGDFDLYIDFHRDSVRKSATTLTYNDKNYAKLMFVVGKTSSNYPTTKTKAEKLSKALAKKVPGISRGVYVKNSHYNQHVAKNMFLIEVGAHQNTYAEVKNSLVVLAAVIDDYLV